MTRTGRAFVTVGLVGFSFVFQACGKKKKNHDSDDVGELGGAGGEVDSSTGGRDGGEDGSGGKSQNGTGGKGTGGKDSGSGSGGSSGGNASGGSGPGGMGGTIGEAPQIELLEPVDILLDCGDSFEDPGATASDEEDGVVMVEVVPGTPVTTTAPGKFTITYEAQDSDGNVTREDRLVSVCGLACGEVGRVPIDLSTWTTVQYEFDKQPNARWVVSQDTFSVLQSVNADASLFLSDFDATDLLIEGKWEIGASTDDDYVGFVFGYQDRGHYYLFDWKRGEQQDDQGFAERGMTMKVVSVPAASGTVVDPTDEDLWQTTESEHATLLEVDGVPLNNDIGWEAEEDYSFLLEFHSGSFKIEIYDAEHELLESWSVFDDTYSGGRFGFYNYSQAPVTYRSFTKRITPPACSTVDE